MADFDWTSLATNILPAAVGAMLGAQRGGVGAIPGGLIGLGTGVRYGMEADADRYKLAQETAFKQQQQQQAQQRIDLDRDQFAAQKERWAREDKTAEQMMQYRDLQMQSLQHQVQEASRSTAARDVIRQSMSSDQERAMFDMNPEAWLKRKDEEIKLQGAGEMLNQFGLTNGDQLAKTLGPQGTAHLLGSIVESRNRPREPFGFHFDESTGTGFIYNKQTGTIIPQKIGEPKVSPEKRTAIENSLVNRWKAQNPMAAKFGEESGDWSAYDEWRASPRGRIEASYLSGETNFNQAQGYRESLQRQERQVSADAIAHMKREYLAVSEGHTEAGFQEYLQTPKGATNLDAYKRAVRKGGQSTEQTPMQTAPGLGPIRFDSSVSPEERKAIESKLGATTTTAKNPLAAAQPKKRPSLDDFFRK